MAQKKYPPLYENGSFRVCQEKSGYAVYENGGTHSTRVAQIGFKGSDGLKRAIAEADRRSAIQGERK